ncbi:MAG TPA: hypothetical protein VFQ44_23505 [Streptosporangiaceae bacterium]|nr:hypothetical protein [Streptosporangiaceae bacterium]
MLSVIERLDEITGIGQVVARAIVARLSTDEPRGPAPARRAQRVNFLDALRLTSESLLTSLDQALRSRGGVAEVRRRSTGHPTHFVIELEFRGGYQQGSYGFEVGAVRGGGFRISRE